MELHKALLGKTVFWGTITAVCYAVMFFNTDFILHMAHSTPSACVVGVGHEAHYFHKALPEDCAKLGGHMEPGTWWHVLVPIAIAFVISFAHGAFTGLFWEVMGLKPASAPKGRR